MTVLIVVFFEIVNIEHRKGNRNRVLFAVAPNTVNRTLHTTAVKQARKRINLRNTLKAFCFNRPVHICTVFENRQKQTDRNCEQAEHKHLERAFCDNSNRCPLRRYYEIIYKYELRLKHCEACQREHG